MHIGVCKLGAENIHGEPNDAANMVSVTFYYLIASYLHIILVADDTSILNLWIYDTVECYQ